MKNLIYGACVLALVSVTLSDVSSMYGMGNSGLTPAEVLSDLEAFQNSDPTVMAEPDAQHYLDYLAGQLGNPQLTTRAGFKMIDNNETIKVGILWRILAAAGVDFGTVDGEKQSALEELLDLPRANQQIARMVYNIAALPGVNESDLLTIGAAVDDMGGGDLGRKRVVLTMLQQLIKEGTLWLVGVGD
ncbi:hypothetical protein FACS189449_09580 [Alphaproteobacteria bacterium]|nr:hypothetical protein FACS189449_09580 [Alphaproteobacteria bacterium]